MTHTAQRPHKGREFRPHYSRPIRFQRPQPSPRNKPHSISLTSPRVTALLCTISDASEHRQAPLTVHVSAVRASPVATVA